MERMSLEDRPVVYVVCFFQPTLIEFVREALPDEKVINIPVNKDGQISDEHRTMLKNEAEVVFADTFIFREDLGEFKKLKLFQCKNSGVNNMHSVMKDMVEGKVRHFHVTRTTMNKSRVSEYVITYILALERRVFEMFECQKQENWHQMEFPSRRTLETLTVGVLGVGTIGSEVARRCKQFGMTVWGMVRSLPTEDNQCPHVDVYRTTQGLVEVLQNCDYLVCNLPSTEKTKGLLSAGILKNCQNKKPIFISTGRGDIIDEESLVTAIKNQWLGGAVLDVTPVEPLPKESPLWNLPNVYITPHIAGYSASATCLKEYAEQFAENFRRFCKGEQLLNSVDIVHGY